MTTLINLAVEAAIKAKEIDLLEFSRSIPDKAFFEFYLKRSTNRQHKDKCMSVDLSLVEDPVLCRRIVEYIWDRMSHSQGSPKTFHCNVILKVHHILKELEKRDLLSYQCFLIASTDVNAFGLPPFTCEVIRSLYKYCLDKDFLLNPFEADVWPLDQLQIAAERLNKAGHHARLDFTGVAREDNRALVKMYTRHLIENSDRSVETIYANLQKIKWSLNAVDRYYVDWDSNDAERFVARITDGSFGKQTVASIMSCMSMFTDYLITHDMLSVSPIKGCCSTVQRGPYNFKETAPDEFILGQIFDSLNSFREDVQLIFLILYCTGMRNSEACQLEKDCLERKGDICYIRYYQPKMKKEVTNAIPLSLYEKIDEYRKGISYSSFLFPGKDPTKSISRQTLSRRIQVECERARIVNADGSPYRFTAHSLRHHMAVRMHDAEIPIQYIARQLHHDSLEMTTAYMEFVDRSKIADEKKWIDAHGASKPAVDTNDIDIEYAEYVRKNINSQILPTGICARPVKLGKCSHLHACLYCDNFRTSPAFLDTLKGQLCRTDALIETAKVYGWKPQLATAEKTRTRLKEIIYSLEKEDNNDPSSK